MQPNEMWNVETQKSLSDWATQTFGPPSSLFSIAARAGEEMAELVRAISKAPWHTPLITSADRAKILMECADVVIILARLADRLNITLTCDPAESGAVLIGSAGNSANLLLADVTGHLFRVTSGVAPNPDSAKLGRDLYWIVTHLAFICDALGSTLADEIDEKMIVNRSRTWKPTNDGHGYHVKPLPADVQKRLNKLDALEANGVDNWEWYGDAMASLGNEED